MKSIFIIIFAFACLSGCVSVYRTPKHNNTATLRLQDENDFDMTTFGDPYTCTSVKHLSFTKIKDKQPIKIPANKLFTLQASFTSIAGKCAPITISFTPKAQQAYVAHLSVDTKTNKCHVTIYQEKTHQRVLTFNRKFKKISAITGQGKCVDSI